MQIKTNHIQQVTPADLAGVLFDSSPEEFAEFWFQFAKFRDKSRSGLGNNPRLYDEKMNKFAKVMAVQGGSLRKQPLVALCDLMKYHEIVQKKDDSAKESY